MYDVTLFIGYTAEFQSYRSWLTVRHSTPGKNSEMFMPFFLIKWTNVCLIKLTHPSIPSYAYMSVNRVNIGSCNGLSPSRRQTIICESMLNLFQSDTQEQCVNYYSHPSRQIWCLNSDEKPVKHFVSVSHTSRPTDIYEAYAADIESYPTGHSSVCPTVCFGNHNGNIKGLHAESVFISWSHHK